jgi:hypothetical protein
MKKSASQPLRRAFFLSRPVLVQASLPPDGIISRGAMASSWLGESHVRFGRTWNKRTVAVQDGEAWPERGRFLLKWGVDRGFATPYLTLVSTHHERVLMALKGHENRNFEPRSLEDGIQTAA